MRSVLPTSPETGAPGSISHVRALSVAAQRTNGQFELVVEGEAGRTYDIWATQDFVDWTLVTEVTLAGQRQVIPDPDAAQFNLRFYRAEAR